MPIAPLDVAARHYLQAFNAHAIAISAAGKVFATRDPAGADTAFWCRGSVDAQRVAKAARASRDIIGAAQRLHVTLTTHERALAQAGAKAEALDRALQEAQACGLLRFFNGAYKARRQAARASGKRFVSYPVARARLLQAVAGAIASGGALERSLVDAALS